MPFGQPDNDRELPQCGTIGPLVAGSLFFPSVNIAVISHLPGDVSILDLHTSLHVGVLQRQENDIHVDDRETFRSKLNEKEGKARSNYRKKQRELRMKRYTHNRGCWYDSKFYPLGGVLLDWQSKFGGYSTTAVRLRARIGDTQQYRNGARIRRVELRDIRRRRAERHEERQRAREEGQQAARHDARREGRREGQQDVSQLMAELNNDAAVHREAAERVIERERNRRRSRNDDEHNERRVARGVEVELDPRDNDIDAFVQV